MHYLGFNSERDNRFVKIVGEYFKENLSKINNLNFNFNIDIEIEEKVQGRSFRLVDNQIYISDFMICDMIKVVGMKEAALYLYDKCFTAVYELYKNQENQIDIYQDLLIIYMDGKKIIEAGLYKKFNLFISSFILDYYKKVESELEPSKKLLGDIDHKIKVGIITETFNGTSRESEEYRKYIENQIKKEDELNELNEILNIFNHGNKNLINTDESVKINQLAYLDLYKDGNYITPKEKEIVTFQTMLNYINKEFWATVNRYYRRNIDAFDFDDLKFLTEYLKEEKEKKKYGSRFVEEHKTAVVNHNGYKFTTLVLYSAFIALIDSAYLKKQNNRRYLKQNKWTFETSEKGVDQNYIIDLKELVKGEDGIENLTENIVFGMIELLTVTKHTKNKKKSIAQMSQEDVERLTKLIKTTILARFFFQNEEQHFEFINQMKKVNDVIMGNMFKTKLINAYINSEDLLLRLELTINEWVSEQQIHINRINNYSQKISIKSEEYETYMDRVINQFDIEKNKQYNFGSYFDIDNNELTGTNLHMDLEKSMYSGLHDDKSN
ncbi:hypothetical protein L2Z53_00250 [Macrococcoides canis]|uniref:hypothetical protein n=1 Tax=Macrococcoides canis TaxID=1855823 RepID=UPI001F40045E|nr:hypothetical protein [Macrococcus canis]UJS27826.1 hypothetical protein L2Z53_00250 [Macrococcus canis]